MKFALRANEVCFAHEVTSGNEVSCGHYCRNATHFFEFILVRQENKEGWNE